jgi:hypothetical protein
MGWFSVLGLALDLIGVVLLGIDLYKIQISQQSAAERTRVTLNDAFPKFRDISTSRTYLESGFYSGGEYESDGVIDIKALDNTLKEYRREIENSSEGVINIIEFMFSSTYEKADEARRSVSFTRVGLGLIILGFLLQVVGTFGANPQLFGAFSNANP